MPKVGEQEYVIGDCLELMKEYPDNHFDLVITSPPYNSGQEYEDDLAEEEYEQLVETWVSGIARVMKHRVAINVPFDNEVRGRGGPVPLTFIWQKWLERSGLKYNDTIIWNKSNSGNDAAWGSWLSASAPHQRHMAEAILIYHKGDWKIGPGDNNIKPTEFTQWTQNVWAMAVAKRAGHPCPYPDELATRIIKLYSHIGATILDPFLGSGTTLKVCIETGRRGVGFEINPDYEAVIRKRLLADVPRIDTWFGHSDDEGGL